MRGSADLRSSTARSGGVLHVSCGNTCFRDRDVYPSILSAAPHHHLRLCQKRQKITFCAWPRHHRRSLSSRTAGTPSIPGAPTAGRPGNPVGRPCCRRPRGCCPALLRHGHLARRGGAGGAAGPPPSLHPPNGAYLRRHPRPRYAINRHGV